MASQQPTSASHTELPAEELISGGDYVSVAFRERNVCGESIDGLKLEDALLSKLRAARTVFSELQLIDVVIEDGDFSNSQWSGVQADRLTVRKCRLTGWNATEASLRHTSLERSKLDLAVFHDAQLRDCTFDNCDLREADFQSANLKNVVFRKCDLRGVRFSGATTQDLDLRGSQIAGLQIEPASLAGTVVDPAQLLELAELLGVVVKPIDEDRVS